MASISETPEPPYYAVIFSSISSELDEGYEQTAELMETLALEQSGYLGIESARTNKFGITVSYWESEEAIKNWKAQVDHAVAQRRGRQQWYQEYAVRVARVERSYTFEADA